LAWFSVGGEFISVIALTHGSVIIDDTRVLAATVVSRARVRLCRNQNHKNYSPTIDFFLILLFATDV